MARARFQVHDEQGFFDGRSLHPRGTEFEIDPEDYNRLLSPYFYPMNVEAHNAISDLREKKKMPKLPGWKVPEPAPDLLNPNDRDDLKALTPGGVKVVTGPQAATVEKK